MSNLHRALDALNDDLIKMIKLVKKQLKLTYSALTELNTDIAEEVIHREQRINALELHVDAQCEQIFALYKPVAVDLRFVLSVLNTSSNLERMADLAEGIAKYVKEMDAPFDKETVKESKLDVAFETAMNMMDDVQKGFKQENSDKARKVLNKDEILDKINEKSSGVIINLSKKNPDNIKNYLFLFSIIKKLERWGDLAENIAEDIIFYTEAQVLKHTT